MYLEITMSKVKIKDQKKSKCDSCKKNLVDFHLHECKRAVQEFYGCSVCDNWCTGCKSNWNNHDKEK